MDYEELLDDSSISFFVTTWAFSFSVSLFLKGTIL